MKNEAHARIKINQLLTDAGWRFFDDEKGEDAPSGSPKCHQHDHP
jgi:hypothetical protein